jgi:hypothetical protein
LAGLEPVQDGYHNERGDRAASDDVLSEKMKVMRKKSPTLYHSSASVLLVRKTTNNIWKIKLLNPRDPSAIGNSSF